MDYKGTIIEESLSDRSVLDKVKIVETKVEPIKPEHKTPWLTQWTLHTVEIPEEEADKLAQEFGNAIERDHTSWYIDYKNDTYHFIIFPDKIFKVDLHEPVLYKEAKAYGISLGIPDYQFEF